VIGPSEEIKVPGALGGVMRDWVRVLLGLFSGAQAKFR
jgi:hypothetical protein